MYRGVGGAEVSLLLRRLQARLGIERDRLRVIITSASLGEGTQAHDDARQFAMDLTGRPNWSSDVPVITVRSGSTELRNLTIQIYEQGEEGMTCEETADFNRCSPHSFWHVAYVPAGGAVTLDGQTGRATVECGGVCESSPDVYGRDGMPPTYTPLECASYCVCLESDIESPPALDAVVTLNVSGRGR